jgi:hypothetical protein
MFGGQNGMKKAKWKIKNWKKSYIMRTYINKTWKIKIMPPKPSTNSINNSKNDVYINKILSFFKKQTKKDLLIN